VAKEELLEMNGVVDEVLPDSRFRVTLDNGHKLLAYSAGKMQKNHIRIIAGDKVSLELSPYDLTKGRITSAISKAAPPALLRRSADFDLALPVLCHGVLAANLERAAGLRDGRRSSGRPTDIRYPAR